MSNIIKIPSRISTGVLAKLGLGHEPTVIATIPGVGAGLTYELSDREGKTYIFTWERPLAVHALRIPLRVWMQNKAKMANDLMGARTQNPVVPLFVVSEILAEEAKAEGQKDSDGGTDDEGDSGDDESSGATEDDSSHAPTRTGPVMIGENTLFSVIAELVAPGAVRIKAVAHQLQVDEESIKAAAQDEGSTIEIAQGGWVRQKTPSEA